MPVRSILIFVLFPLLLAAQKKSITKKDSASTPADSLIVTQFNEFQLREFSEGRSFNIISNKLDAFQDFHQKNANLGNAGSAERNLYLHHLPVDGFSRSHSSFSYFGFNDKNRTFFSCDKPYTGLTYIVGQKQEVDVQITHAHPLGKNALIALSFDRTRSTGFYRKQETNNTSIDLNGWYRSPGRCYAFLADMYWTALHENENGGIKSDASFFNTDQLDRQLVSVYLSSANNFERYREAWFKQYFTWGTVVDTISTDSGEFKTKIRPEWAIVHTISIRDEVYRFSDNDTVSGFYPATYSDTSLTNDSTYLWKARSGLWLERFNSQYGYQLLSGRIGARAEAGELFADTIYQHFQNFFLDGSLRWNAHHRHDQPPGILTDHITLSGWYIINGNNSGDFDISLNSRPEHNSRRFSLWVNGEWTRSHPDFIFQHYSGNHYQWVNEFQQTDHLEAKIFMQYQFNYAHYRIKHENANFIQISFADHNFIDPVYLDSTDFLPAQYSGSINCVEAQLRAFLSASVMRSETEFTFNYIPSNVVIHLPQFIIRESIYAEFRLFKSALLLQTGLDANYFSSFYCDAYSANLAQFLVQNSFRTSDYVYLDGWVSLKIKPVRVFVKADHFNSAFMGKRYMLVPHYPQNDFCLKFGVSWKFND